MARPIRVEYPGAVDHVTARGNVSPEMPLFAGSAGRGSMRGIERAVENPPWGALF